jgi:hypothetical protein
MQGILYVVACFLTVTLLYVQMNICYKATVMFINKYVSRF